MGRRLSDSFLVMVVQLVQSRNILFRHVLFDLCWWSSRVSLIYFVSFQQFHKVDDKREYWKVVKVKDVSRGKSLIDSRCVNLKYKTEILERYSTRIVVKGYLWKDDFDLLSSFALTFSHVAVRLAFAITSIPGFFVYHYDSVFLYQYRNEFAWKTIPGYPLKDDECLEL